MKNMLTFLFCLSTAFAATAQDDLMNELDKETKPTTNYTTATFKSTRIITGHSNETIAAKHMDFRICHRFGALNSGYKELFGLDVARVRISFEYGITDDLMVGVGRSGLQKTYDYFVKYKLLKQSSGKRNMPVSVSLFANAATKTLDTSPDMQFLNNMERQTYCTQVLIARKFSDNLSLQLTPTFLHRNKVETAGDPNSLMVLGMGGRTKLSKRTSLNVEYWLVPQARTANYTNCLSLGFDIETGGHVFQLHLSNSRGMVENQFIGQTTGRWTSGDIFYGFNISRTFSFDRAARNIHK